MAQVIGQMKKYWRQKVYFDEVIKLYPYYIVIGWLWVVVLWIVYHQSRDWFYGNWYFINFICILYRQG